MFFSVWESMAEEPGECFFKVMKPPTVYSSTNTLNIIISLQHMAFTDLETFRYRLACTV